VIVPVMLSVKDSARSVSNYQNFIERTRYLRRGDYTLSNLLIAPFIFEEVGYGENYSSRLITSFVRHNTVISKPITAYLHNRAMLNESDVYDDFEKLITAGNAITAARYAEVSESDIVKYKPVGYILSVNKEEEDNRLNKREASIKSRYERLLEEGARRLADPISKLSQQPDRKRPAPMTTERKEQAA